MTARADKSSAIDWVFDPVHGVYYHAQSQMYAIPTASGQWEYVPITDFRPGQSSRAVAEKEDGEVDDDVGWGGLMESTEVERIQRSGYSDPAVVAYGASTPVATPKHILRLVVSESSVLPQGGMAMVDAREGGIHIGRDRMEGQTRLRVKEMEVSKTHAVVYWGRGCERVEEEREGDEDEGWWIVDLGSTHGTFVTHDSVEVRLSKAKASSLPHRLHHLSSITLGHTRFVAHIHSSWPCDACQLKADTEIKLDDGEPAVEAAPSPAYVHQGGRELREIKRKREMALLKETLLDDGSGLGEARRDYQNRAAMRRRLHHPSPKSVQPLPDEPVAELPVKSFAAGILASQGWVQGQGLGKAGEGRANPIQVAMRAQKRGLGAAGSTVVEGDWRAQGKERRYNELRPSG